MVNLVCFYADCYCKSDCSIKIAGSAATYRIFYLREARGWWPTRRDGEQAMDRNGSGVSGEGDSDRTPNSMVCGHPG